jgi:thiamine-monophosphate kinase
MLKNLYEGIDAACTDYNIQLAGSDITASHQILVLSATATGLGNKDKVVRQSGAKQDHIICVTGDLGAAIAGLRVLLREKSAWKESGQNHFQPDLGDYEYVVQRQLVPKARMDLLKGFAQAGITPSSMTDITRGVVNDLQRIGKQSESGIEIYSPAVPISFEVRNVADEMKEDVDKYAFYGGEDFEMAFTIREEEVEKLKADFDDFSVIGKMVEKEKQFIINTGEDKTIKFDLFET